MTNISTRGNVVTIINVFTVAMAIGAYAVGALAIGRLAIGALTLRHGRVRSLLLDEVSVARLEVCELVVDRA